MKKLLDQFKNILGVGWTAGDYPNHESQQERLGFEQEKDYYSDPWHHHNIGGAPGWVQQQHEALRRQQQDLQNKNKQDAYNYMQHVQKQCFPPQQVQQASPFGGIVPTRSEGELGTFTVHALVLLFGDHHEIIAKHLVELQKQHEGDALSELWKFANAYTP
ncbi:MAG: hypothetical protein GY906_24705 [bacterium]|nr:hypothetical protein [bacterium]